MFNIKRKVFISYHHSNDAPYFEALSNLISNAFDIAVDRSVNRALDSNDPQYVMRRIRENHISGSSCTIILVGNETYKRKYVDWEIKATLDKTHGLLGVNLPTNLINFTNDSCNKPARLQDNIDSGYAVWEIWEKVYANPQYLTALIEGAATKSKLFIRNDREPMRQNSW